MSSYDYNMMGEPEVNNLIPVPMVFDNTKCTGIVKLAQRVLILFLKDEQSSFSTGVGTNILEMSQTGNVLANGEIGNMLTLATTGIKEAIQNSVTATTPESEQLKDLKATFQTDPINRTALQVSLQVQSVSGITINMSTNLNLAG
jgi:hypothetical protein